MPYRYIDLSYLGIIAGEDAETRKQLLALLIEDLEEQLPALGQLFRQQDWPALFSVSHHLKSTFAFAGNEGMTSANRLIERHLREAPDGPQQDFIAAQVEAMESLLPQVLAELRQEYQKT
ncbi:MAG: Hpt domain-containing protein [Phaeodactylibacter sp.]|nr:Hpt domain-containing protein [Phaeodactylibacter sp.]MCB9275169.1 Hpt domain-containing protein [Lewinellaceae bacterium]